MEQNASESITQPEEQEAEMEVYLCREDDPKRSDDNKRKVFLASSAAMTYHLQDETPEEAAYWDELAKQVWSHHGK